MQIKDAQMLFEAGVMVKFQIVPNPVIPAQWVLQMENKNKQRSVVSTVRWETKSYKTLEAVLNDVRKITGRVSGLELIV